MPVLSSLFRRLQHHTWTERVTLSAAALCCLAMWGALRVCSFATLVRWTGNTSSRGETGSRERVNHIVWAVRTVGHDLFPNRPCLPQALAARFLLARLGRPTELHIGVRSSEADGIRAHAWLKHEQEVLIGGADAPMHYHVLTAS